MTVDYSWLITSVLLLLTVIGYVIRWFCVKKDYSWSSIFVVALLTVLFVVSLIFTFKQV